MAWQLLIALLLISTAQAKLPGETSALWNQQGGTPKTMRPDPTNNQCIRVSGNATSPRICSLDGVSVCIDTNNNTATCEAFISQDGTFGSSDLQATGDNRIEILDNDAAVTPDPSCSAKCPAGTFCVLDTNETAADRWVICDGPTEIAAISDLAVTIAWMAPFGGAGSSLLYSPPAGTCECYICPVLRPMPAISHMGYRVAIPDADDTPRFGVYTLNGQTQLFSCLMDFTTTGAKECANTVTLQPVLPGNNICCMSRGSDPAGAIRASGDSEMTMLRHQQVCTGGSMPATLTANPPIFTRQVSPAPFVEFVFGIATTTSSTSSSSTSSTSSSSSTSSTSSTSTTSTSSTTTSTAGGQAAVNWGSSVIAWWNLDQTGTNNRNVSGGTCGDNATTGCQLQVDATENNVIHNTSEFRQPAASGTSVHLTRDTGGNNAGEGGILRCPSTACEELAVSGEVPLTWGCWGRGDNADTGDSYMMERENYVLAWTGGDQAYCLINIPGPDFAFADGVAGNMPIIPGRMRFVCKTLQLTHCNCM